MPSKKRKTVTPGENSNVREKKESKKQKEEKPKEECIENMEMNDESEEEYEEKDEEEEETNGMVYHLTEEEKENKILYLPNEIVSIPVKRQDGTVVARAIVRLIAFKEKKLDSCTYHLTSGYAKSSIQIYLHETIMGYKAPKGFVIDHRNRNRLDNTPQNLRIITDALNAINRIKKQDTHSRFYGVTLDDNKWRPSSRWNGKKRWLGSFDFDKEIEAAKKYDRFILAAHGIDAREATNTFRFPNEKLLTESEIQSAIKSKPEDYFFKRKNGLPRNITNLYNKFQVRINVRQHPSFYKSFDTLEEAIKARDDKLEEIKAAKKAAILNQNIVRNSQNEAILKTNKTSGTSYDFTVDDGDYYYLYQYAWSAALVNNKVEIFGNINGNTKKLHEVVWERHHPNQVIPEGMSIDHIDRSHLNAKSSNLRLLTASNQSHNQKRQSETGITGVYDTRTEDRWVARIKINNQDKHLGTFDSETLASEAYKKASAVYYPGTLVF